MHTHHVRGVTVHVAAPGPAAVDCYGVDTGRQLASGTVVGMEIENCPEQRCQMPTEVVHRFTLASTAGPVEHVALRCVDRHQFVMPSEALRIAS
jgi:hypothetical protein